MSRKKRMQNLREAKDKRMKKIAIGGAAVLVLVLAFEVPHVLKGSGGGSSATPPATTNASAPVAGTAAPATTPPGTAAAAVTPAASTKLPTSDVAPRVGKSQLHSFTRFLGKDPFVQQVRDKAQGLPNQTAAVSHAPASAGNGATTPPKHASRVLAVTGAARIVVNGRAQVVRVGTSFPSANPLFRLVSFGNGVARIAIANGSYSSGAHTVALAAGRTLTLVDTADGIRYQLRLLS
ncbi:MAG TPA: hypothetical protein VE985_03690 [Gaiellaceae bacterium]|nr:hypothetical protein [Gaiellaceae bacterium]